LETKSAELKPQREGRSLFDGKYGAIYSLYIEREALSRVGARLLWCSDIRPFYESMGAIAHVRDGTTIIDAPCGSGVAFGALRPDQRVRYIALDLSQRMLERARERAKRLGLRQVEFLRGDAAAIPVPDETADLFLSYWGLHCFEDPGRAAREAARCLRRDGLLVGTTFVKGDRPLDRLRVRPGLGPFGQVGSSADVRAWLKAASLSDIELDVRGVFAYFEARKRS
jgi:SAM-dependent methyltransferase